MHRREWIYLGASLGGTAALSALLSRAPRGRTRGLSESGLERSDGPLGLPPGFRQTVLSRSGALMDDGLRTPDLPDGMACFQGSDGTYVLMRNHELGKSPSRGAFPEGQPPLAFDRDQDGGVSRLIVDPATLGVKSSNMVLTGTTLNCSGGPSPFGYLTCEETENTGHGWVFLCDPAASSLQAPRPLHGYGRFRHEAAAVDPRTHCAYLSEDQNDGCLYRFVPRDPGAPFEGRLEVARAASRANFDTAAMKRGASIGIEWVEVPDPAAKETPTREQGGQRGALTIRRAEGIWFDAGRGGSRPSVLVSATTGGAAGKGQIFRLILGEALGPDRLELIAEAPTRGGLQFPDNITVAPWGEPIVAEDGMGPQHLRGIRSDGTSYVIARNVASDSEFAGVCFSPDGSTLFCNLQRDGLTIAIRGPWEKVREFPSS